MRLPCELSRRGSARKAPVDHFAPLDMDHDDWQLKYVWTVLAESVPNIPKKWNNKVEHVQQTMQLDLQFQK